MAQFNLRKETQDVSNFVDMDIVALKFRRIHRMIRVAAANAFNNHYGEVKGFEYKIEGGDGITDATSILEVNNKFQGGRSVTLKYKITCDKGDPEYCDLYFRTPRANYINEMISFINKRNDLKNAVGITNVELKTEDGGKNPTLFVRMLHSYPGLDKKGKKVTKYTTINLNFSLKYAGADNNAKALASLKPKHVKPKIVDVWLTPETLYNNVISYVGGSDFPSQSNSLKQSYKNIITDAYTNKSLKDKVGIAADLSSEFFEILSALKLCILLKANDRGLKQTLGLPDGETVKSIEVKIPEAANEALVDYFVAVNGNKENPLQISVKSKVRGSSTATVKFTTAFANEREVLQWFNNIKSTVTKNKQLGQYTIASSALNYSQKYSGRLTMYPIKGLLRLLSGPKSSTVRQDLNRVLDLKGFTIPEFIDLLKKTDKKMGTLKANYDPFDDIFSTDIKFLAKVKTLLAHNIYDESGKKNKLIEAISLPQPEAAKKNGGKYPFSVNNLALLCERVLVETSKRDGQTKLNFYKMFYDQVLTKNKVAYAMTSRETVGDEVKLKYSYISAVDFGKYKKWIALRSKNYANNMQDALGMAV